MAKYVDNPAVQWSGLDIEAFITISDPIIELTKEQSEKLQDYFDNEMENVIESYRDDIIEFINLKIQDHIYYNKKQIKQEINSILNN